MPWSKLKRLSATHRTELFLLALSGVFDISFGVEKLFQWAGKPLSPLTLAIFFLAIGALTTVVGVYNLKRDINCDCEDHHDA